MYEWKSGERGDKEQAELEERLAVYYSPRLREQPLPASSWQRLQARIGSQPSRKFQRLRLRLWHHPQRSRRSVPAYIQEAFSRIVHEARLSHTPAIDCAFKFRLRAPAVHVSLLRRQAIKLMLPLDGGLSIEQAELEVLLAGGLARYLCIRKSWYVLLRLALITLLLLACALAVFFWRFGLAFIGLPIAIIVLASSLWLLNAQRRAMAFAADNLVVKWLGRNRACQGLHALADRSRKPHRRAWGEPSLAERINRVCGTQVVIEDERLTLVR